MKPSTMLKIIAVSISMAILTACASTGSHSNPKVGTPEQSHDYLQSKPLQTLLKSSLNPQDYAGFNANLKQFSAPFALKEGSKYYETRDDNTITASAIEENQVSASDSSKSMISSRVEYVNLADSGLPPDEIEKLTQDFSNLKTYGSYSKGKITHEFANTEQFKVALKRHGSFENVVKHLNFVPTDVSAILGKNFQLIGADYSGAFNKGKYNSVFRSYQNRLGQRFEINEMLLNDENNGKLTVYNEALNFDVIGHPATLQKLKGVKEQGREAIYDLDFNVGNRVFSISAEGLTYQEFITVAHNIARQTK